MDCKTARMILELFPTNSQELADDEREALEHHLTQCRECDQLAQRERRLDHHLSTAMRDVPIPGGLKSRIYGQLNNQGKEKRQKRWSRAASLAAAAVVLLALGYWIFTRPSTRTKVSFDEIALELTAPDNMPKKGEIEQWFANNDMKVTLPAEFNYRFLAVYTYRPLANKQVPFLLFRQGPAELEVYLLPSSMFNLKDWPEVQRVDSGGKNVEIRRQAKQVYLCVYKSGVDLKRFLN